MKRYETQDIRNVVLVGHGGAGKTSLAEAILYDGRGTTRRGVAGSDSSNFDYEPEEIKRQGTIQPAVGYVEWQKKKINFIDTPGDQNFLVETRVAMQIPADAAVVVVSCPDGVQVVTETVWQACEEFALPRAIFVNKMDRERASWEGCLEAIRAKLSDKAVALQLPIGTESGFDGIIDLLHLKALRFAEDGTVMKVEPVPPELVAVAGKAREKLIEDIASSDDGLLETYLGTGELTEPEIINGLKRAINRGLLVPVLLGSAGMNVGIQPLLDLIVAEFPSPDTRPARVGQGAHGEAIQRHASADQPFSAWVWKTIGADIGKVSLARVLSGRLAADATLWNSSRHAHERAGSLYAFIGKKRETVPEVVAGDIVGLAKLKVTKTGDALCDEKAPMTPPPLTIPAPLIKYAIRAKSKGDEDKLGAKLHDLVDEDLALRIEHDQASKDILLAGMGQSHIEVSVDKLRRLGVDVDLLPPKIPYLEAIRGRAKNIEGKHKKQTGGKGQYGVCYIDMEPLPRGTGFEFVDAIVGGAIPRQFIPAVEKGIRARMSRGVVAGYPVTDVKVTLLDGKYHDVDSDSRSFEMAGSKAFFAAFRLCKPTLLEPVMDLEIRSPDEHMGDIMGDINSRRGRVLGVESSGKGQTIHAQVPMIETLKYAADLRSMTGGRGSFTVAFSHYDELPPHLTERVIAEHKVQEEEE